MKTLLHAGVVFGAFRQRGDQQLARQLANAPLGIGDGLQREILAPAGAEIDRASGPLEAERLRPDLILAGGQQREVIGAGSVSVDAGRDRRALLLGRHRHALELLPRRRGNRAAQRTIGGLGPRHDDQS